MVGRLISMIHNYDVNHRLGLSKMSAWRALKQVTTLINNQLYRKIDWPDTEAKCRQVAMSFMTLATPAMPCVCGAVDGTLIELAYVPHEFEHQYVDRHHRHSINAMAVAGPDYRLYAFSSRWPGSVNDARVIRNSDMAARFERGWRPFDGAVLLGDSIYGASDWLLPMRARSPAQYAQFYRLW